MLLADVMAKAVRVLLHCLKFWGQSGWLGGRLIWFAGLMVGAQICIELFFLLGRGCVGGSESNVGGGMCEEGTDWIARGIR